MALEPLLSHGVTVGEGAGALLALPLVQAAAALAAELPEKPQASEASEASEVPEKEEPEEEPSAEVDTKEETA
jgi:nicotinate-nucleotide--dimethylbenzimidazole phosphoribosyltransferase